MSSRSTDRPDHATASPLAARGTDVEVRLVATHEEYGACVQLQRETWGPSFNEVVPATLLKIANRIGGVTAGAFDAERRLVGFVYGMTGIEAGRLVHWSHMLAVRPELRDAGIGARLKRFQRELLAAQGVERMYWTFDPLVARNAHLNLMKLRGKVREYVPEMYPDTGSELHDVGTDRFLVSWSLGAGSETDAGRTSGLQGDVAPSVAGSRVVNAPTAADPEAPTDPVLESDPVVRIEIPEELERVLERSREQALRWRETTRAAFRWYLGRGYEVSAFERDPATGRCWYVLAAPLVTAGG